MVLIYLSLLITWILCPFRDCADSIAIVSKFTITDAGNTEKFVHLHVHRDTGTVYVGAVNRLFQLDPDLALEESVVTGPVDENSACPPHDDCSGHPRALKPNENPVLIPYYEREQLIVCGTANYGRCVMRDMKNITELLESDSVEEAVIPMDAELSVVAFVAPGPSNAVAGSTSHVLYVGRSVYAGSEDNLLALSSRSLDPRNLFQLAYNDLMTGTGTYVMVDSTARQQYKINYVYGFASGRFSYFITTQPRSTDRYEPLQSKLVRICQDDKNYHSYTEMPLVCVSKDKTYDVAQAASIGNPGAELAAEMNIKVTDDILVVAFTDQTKENDRNRPGSSSTVCRYSLAQIQRQFANNIRQCFTGNGKTGFSFSRQTKQCLKSYLEVRDDFCGSDFNYPISGSIPIAAASILTYPEGRITAVALSVTHIYTVLFLGTEKGVLKKVYIDPKRPAREYEEISLSSVPILPDMHISPAKEFIYAATASQISKIRIHNCSAYNTCGDCLVSQDPYCGWCSYENKCSLRSQCSSAYWLPLDKRKCFRIISVTPNQIQRTTSRTIALEVGHLPHFNGPLVCVFSAQGRSLETNAIRTQDGVSCLTPRADLLPQLPDGGNALSVRVAIQEEGTGNEFGADFVTFFDCATFNDCTSCVVSPLPCDWCLQNHRCTSTAEEECPSDYLVNGHTKSGYNARSGPDFCPRTEPAEGFVEAGYILVPSGLLREVKVNVENIQPFQTRLTCVFNIDGQVERTEASYVGDKVLCSPLKFAYDTTAPNVTAHFAVEWADRKPLDNPKNLHAVVYKCSMMAPNCGLCLDLPSEFECGWCEKNCQVAHQCPGVWLNKNSTCPNPEIQQFYPSLGPWEGGTMVTIKGINLGKTFDDIASGVQVAGRRCSPLPDRYASTSRIVCQTDAVEQLQNNQILSGDVQVAVAQQFIARSTSEFSYVDPQVIGFSPKLGPMSGGMQLTIHGRYLNAGSRVVVKIGKNVCNVQQRNATTLTCVTSRADAPTRGSIEMIIDRGRRQLKEPLFEYVADPEITIVTSFGSGQINLGPRGTASGGSYIFVEGSNLNVVTLPRIVVRYSGKDYEGICLASSDIRMECRSPTIPALDSPLLWHGSMERPLELHYGFYLDDVQSARNISRLGTQFPKFKLYPDPVVANFSDHNGIKHHNKEEYLLISGENLNQVFRLEDYRVEIGLEVCNVTSLTQSQIICRPPRTAPLARRLDGDVRWETQPEVRVAIAGRPAVTIGTLTYEPLTVHPSTTLTDAQTGAIAGAVAFMVVLVLIIAVWKKRSRGRATAPVSSFASRLVENIELYGKLRVIDLPQSLSHLPNIDEQGYLKPSVQDDRTQCPLNQSDLINFAYQICRGMLHLTSHDVIHRDLAARNVLVCDNKIVKICDFGLAKQNSEYYRMRDKNTPMPVKWMAPQSVMDLTFSVKTDVWSFGIVMWEIFSFGEDPYSDIIRNFSIAAMQMTLSNGSRPLRPLNCSEKIYEIMKYCWNYDPVERPTFAALNGLIEPLTEQRARDTYAVLDQPYRALNMDYVTINLVSESRKSATHYVIDSAYSVAPITSEIVELQLESAAFVPVFSCILLSLLAGIASAINETGIPVTELNNYCGFNAIFIYPDPQPVYIKCSNYKNSATDYNYDSGFHPINYMQDDKGAMSRAIEDAVKKVKQRFSKNSSTFKINNMKFYFESYQRLCDNRNSFISLLTMAASFVVFSCILLSLLAETASAANETGIPVTKLNNYCSFSAIFIYPDHQPVYIKCSNYKNSTTDYNYDSGFNPINYMQDDKGAMSRAIEDAVKKVKQRFSKNSSVFFGFEINGFHPDSYQHRYAETVAVIDISNKLTATVGTKDEVNLKIKHAGVRFDPNNVADKRVKVFAENSVVLLSWNYLV
ncbi:plexin-A2-like [Paramacrobiotus metropolitanus]|uniref:plexin-A2-like n=1 Tax=Paramacrobiotus metropolitanus TaxID=2943436 RepID=UPI002445A964|nr:plexin-A2-like [Paramacrobiotus metropolitanus]